ncbi:MAG: MotA/TolQ/ExbB proton channel family protein [Elusimicrobia bacterium]|nr:MotA/TolQ/ExbB proton channel family protein [Elusimicrobiota bacterium]
MGLIDSVQGAAALQTTHSVLILGILVGCSLLCVAMIIERWLYFRKVDVNPEAILLKIRHALTAGKTDEALSILGDPDGSPILLLIHSGIKNSQLPREQVTELMRACQMRQRAAMEKNLGVLGTLGNTAPFIGLLGTVLGIIQAFRDLATPQAQAAGASVVAVGIAEALVATAAGLVVAIPAVVFYNYFLKRVKHMLTEMEVVVTEMAVLLSLKDSTAAGGGSHGRAS